MRRCWLLALLLLAACNGAPPPIMARAAPAAALSPPDSAGIYVLPGENAPAASAGALAAAMATALQQADVPASAQSSNRGSYRLQPVATATSGADGRATIRIVWELRNAAGKAVGSTSSGTVADAAAWQRGDDKLAAALAASAAPAVAKLIAGDVSPPQGGLNPVVALRPVAGAPGDGDRSLTRAMSSALTRANLTLAAAPSDNKDFIVAGTVDVSPPEGATTGRGDLGPDAAGRQRSRPGQAGERGPGRQPRWSLGRRRLCGRRRRRARRPPAHRRGRAGHRRPLLRPWTAATFCPPCGGQNRCGSETPLLHSAALGAAHPGALPRTAKPT